MLQVDEIVILYETACPEKPGMQTASPVFYEKNLARNVYLLLLRYII
jgi:hypothetical protein